MVVQEAKRLTLLVDNLLAMSRITDATEVYSFEALPADGVLEASLRTFAPQLDDAGFTVDVRVAPDLPFLRGDRTALSLLFDNLIDNAIRYSPDSKALIIDATRDGDFLSIAVTDRGRGIPPEEIDHVTRKFFRGRSAVRNGSGLGLAIVKRIVTDHGGQLSIRSAVGAGTTVTIRLPAWQDHEEADSRR
jgi:signal transduction histidine kinase